MRIKICQDFFDCFDVYLYQFFARFVIEFILGIVLFLLEFILFFLKHSRFFKQLERGLNLFLSNELRSIGLQ